MVTIAIYITIFILIWQLGNYIIWAMVLREHNVLEYRRLVDEGMDPSKGNYHDIGIIAYLRYMNFIIRDFIKMESTINKNIGD